MSSVISTSAQHAVRSAITRKQIGSFADHVAAKEIDQRMAFRRAEDQPRGGTECLGRSKKGSAAFRGALSCLGAHI
jgi:hypothetical protein